MMTRVLLTFLVGLLVSLGALVSGVDPVLAKEKVYWEGTVNGKPVQVTNQGVFLSGKFRSAFQLSDDEKCTYFFLDEPGYEYEGFVEKGETWGRAVTGIDYTDCKRRHENFKRRSKILETRISDNASDNVEKTASASKFETRSKGTSAAFAETFECKRHTQAHTEFKTQSDFELWFPKEISLDIYNWKSREGYKSLKKVEKQIEYLLLPNGKMNARVIKYSESLGKALRGNINWHFSHFQKISRIHYECNRTSLQLVAGLKKEHEEESKVKTTANSDNTSTKVKQNRIISENLVVQSDLTMSLTSGVKIKRVGHKIVQSKSEFIASLYDEILLNKPNVLMLLEQNNREKFVVEDVENLRKIFEGDLATLAKFNSAPKAKPKVTSAALTAAEKEAERLRQELAALKAEKAKQQQTISSDKKLPMITIASASSNGPQGTIVGRVTDNTGVAEVRMDGKTIKIDSNGNFSESTYVPEGGVSVSIQAVDLAGLSSSMSVRLDRSASNTATSISFERLNPLGRKVAKNKDALALIIGVDGYENTPARAIYADSDAKVFADYASQKLGIPSNRIKTLVNNGADEKGMLLAVKDWLSRASKKDKTDVYVFFAGHGLASQDGKKMYLLPYDGSPRLLEKTAILRDELFADIASTNPRSVTVFLDTCYSGETRGNKMLIAGRPISIRALERSIPDNFTLMTAAAADQIANPLKEAKHGMFSYFLMKGMEGIADTNQDNKITALELHEYVKENVWKQSSNKQLPELQGDANRVLVQFQ